MSAIQDHRGMQGAATGQALWHNRDYLLLLFGQAVSFAGSQVSQFAFPHIVLLGAIITILTIASALQGTVLYPYRLALIPDALQGRVNSVFRMVSLAGSEVGLALTGDYYRCPSLRSPCSSGRC